MSEIPRVFKYFVWFSPTFPVCSKFPDWKNAFPFFQSEWEPCPTTPSGIPDKEQRQRYNKICMIFNDFAQQIESNVCFCVKWYQCFQRRKKLTFFYVCKQFLVVIITVCFCCLFFKHRMHIQKYTFLGPSS